mmetsp:Transcript_16550/g.37186  ORF Transcript_16550/g.37186 Transcript_16550/m.37186 type:complete len:166 (+) Transcript_16550:988-1485(+)
MSVYLSDLTEDVLENLKYNVDRNVGPGFHLDGACPIETGILDWHDECFQDNADRAHLALDESDVLLGADVVYIPEDIPGLVQCIGRFLLSGTRERCQKCAIIAATKRTQHTFRLFQKEMDKMAVEIVEVGRNIIDHCLPRVFPCYFVQPREDIHIFVIRQSFFSE